MSLYLDVEYARRVGSQLNLFNEEGNGKFTFRCPFCGDSQKDKRTKRAALFPSEGTKLGFNCLNCGVGTTFQALLEHVDVSLRDEYVMDSLKENGGGSRPLFAEDKMIKAANRGMGLEALFAVSAPEPTKSSPLDHLTPLTNLPEDHPAVRYVMDRLDSLSDLMYTDNFGEWANTYCGKELPILKRDPRVVAPLRTRDGMPIGGQGRAMNSDSKLRYITATFNNNETIAYGLDKADFTKEIWLLEGVYDALSVDNGVAVLNSSLGARAEALGLDKKTTVLMFDNEPGNIQIRNAMKKAVDAGWRVAFYIGDLFKDANDMFNDGYNYRDYVNVQQGLSAQMEMAKWSGNLSR